MGLNTDVKGRTVIIVEDIVETGNTIEELCRILKEAGAADIKVLRSRPVYPLYTSRRPLAIPPGGIFTETAHCLDKERNKSVQ